MKATQTTNKTREGEMTKRERLDATLDLLKLVLEQMRALTEDTSDDDSPDLEWALGHIQQADQAIAEVLHSVKLDEEATNA